MSFISNHMERVWVIICSRCKKDEIQYGEKLVAELKFIRNGWENTERKRLVCRKCYRELNQQAAKV